MATSKDPECKLAKNLSDGVKTQRKRGRGKPFKPGNPGGGRKKIPPDLKKMFEMMSLEGAKMAQAALGDPKTPLAMKVKILEISLDRHLGKPHQSIGVEGGGNYVLVFPVNMDGV